MHIGSRKTSLALAGIAILLWTLDTIFDTVFAHRGTFSDFFALDVPLPDIVFRLLFITVVTALIAVYLKQEAKRRSARDELHRHLTAIETSMDGIALFDDKHVYRYANPAYARITGFAGPGDLLGSTFSLIYDEQQQAWLGENVFPALERTGRWYGEIAAHRRNGEPFIQEASITRMQDGGCVCVMRDITDRKRRDEELQRSGRFLHTIFDSIRDPFCIFDRDYRIVRANDAYAELKNKVVGDLVDRTCFEVLEGRSEVCEGCVIRKTLQSGDPCAKEKEVALRTGGNQWLEIYTYPMLDNEDRVTHVIEYTRDITDRKRMDEDRKRLIDRLEHLSRTDGLTGLLNRRALTDHLVYEIERVRRYGGDLSLILCDMDNLKEINDTRGHLAGDLAIQLLSATVRNSVRNVDLVGRYGGDEFLVIVPGTGAEAARNIAEKIQASVRRMEVSIEGQAPAAVSVSIGIADLAPTDTIDRFISRVDAALYVSKQAGRDRITLSDQA
jgi:diguanylate cyclase (GGDEF)-like protein/PAS domain S-box-containing protein